MNIWTAEKRKDKYETSTVRHGLTHYFQRINDIELTDAEYERQAKKYSELIIYEYSQIREHP